MLSRGMERAQGREMSYCVHWFKPNDDIHITKVDKHD